MLLLLRDYSHMKLVEEIGETNGYHRVISCQVGKEGVKDIAIWSAAVMGTTLSICGGSGRAQMVELTVTGPAPVQSHFSE